MYMKIHLLVIISMISLSSTMVFAHPGHAPEDELLQKGIQAYTQEKFDKAMSIFDLILEHNPDNFDALNNKGVILNTLGSFVEAQTYFGKVLEVRPKSVMTLNNIGTSFVGQGDLIQAILYFDKALEIDPEHVNTLNNKGDALVQLGRYKKAISIFDKALEIDPEHIKSLGNKGKALIKLHRYQEAFIPLNDIMRIDPENKQAITALQKIQYKLDYMRVDGFTEIQVNDSQGNLVTHFRTKNLNVLNNSLAEEVVNSFSVKKIIIRDGQEFEVLQRKIVIHEDSDSTPGRTGFNFTYNPEIWLGFSTHYQYILKEGDVVTFYPTIFRPIL